LSVKRLELGSSVRVVKLRPDGTEAATYEAVVFDFGLPAPWVSVRAIWTLARVEVGGLSFEYGDMLHEHFSADHWFNLFEIFGSDGRKRGWYANVTYPARIELEPDPPTIYWGDLYIDVIGLPGREPEIRDEDELEASGIGENDLALYREVVDAQDEILKRFQAGIAPFGCR
jgi:predicted RNA-binding protein associated with RNAse of E/G family